MPNLKELMERDRAAYMRGLPTILRDIKKVAEGTMQFAGVSVAQHAGEAATEIDRLRDNLNEAVRVLRAIATSPRDLTPGYDHYSLCRETARMAADNIDRVLTY